MILKIERHQLCINMTFESKDDYLGHISSEHDSPNKNLHMCSECGKQFKTKGELTHHNNSKCGTIKQYKCQVCNQNLMTPGSLHNHMLRHNGERSYMCRFCAKLFLTAGQLKVHERSHTGEKAFVCAVCGKGFCHRQSLVTHNTIHTGIKPYQCENCGNSFSCVGNLLKHRKTHSDTCGLIPLTTNTVKNPATKMKVKINTPANSKLKKQKHSENKLKCIKTKKKCNKSEKLNTEENKPTDSSNWQDNSITLQIKEEELSSDQQERIYVMETANNEINNFEPCADYDEEDGINDVDPLESNNYETSSSITIVPTKKLNDETSNIKRSKHTKKVRKKLKRKRAPKNNSYSLKSDRSTTASDDESKETGKKIDRNCKYCNKSYSNFRWLARHEKLHEDQISQTANNEDRDEKQKSIRCSCCKVSFLTKEECKTHQLNEHADILTCHECEKIFSNTDSLRSHQNIFHKGLPRKVYTYVCEKCGTLFRQKASMKHHENSNCGGGPYFACNICGKQFSSIHVRNCHLRVHDPEKKLLCKFCGKSFHWKGQLKIHERSHTGEKPFKCLYCPKAFAYRESLITHSSLHTGIKPHLCEACGSRFSCIGNLIKHRSTHASTCGIWYNKNNVQTS